MGPLAATVLVLAVIWFVRLYLFPYRACPRCNGSSRRPGSSRSSWGICRKCGGTGNTPRPAARWLGIGEDD